MPPSWSPRAHLPWAPLLLASLLLAPLGLGACGPKKGTLPTAQVEVAGKRLKVEVADDPDERELGLMYRDSLHRDRGMLFVYPGASRRSFWMKNTSIPLSIAFIDPQGRILNIEDMVPFNTSSVPSKGEAQYALEMNKGWFAANGIKPGDVITDLPPASAE